MLRHGRTTDRQALSQLVHRLRCTPQFLQQIPPVPVSNGSEGVSFRHWRRLRQTPISSKSFVQRSERGSVQRNPAESNDKKGFCASVSLFSVCLLLSVDANGITHCASIADAAICSR